MHLAKIKEDVRKFADVISKTLDVDVLIVDSNLKVVGNTFRYFDKYTGIRRVSVIGQVLTTGEVVAIDDRSNFGACKVCPDSYDCEMRGFIGVPISYRDCVVGAIGLIMPQQRIARIFQDVRNSIEFLESMADLLANKLRVCDDYTALSVVKQEREVLMDAIDDAIVSTDITGYISYYNKSFAKRFCPGQNFVDRMLSELMPHKMVRACLENPVEVRDKLISFDDEDRPFYGLMCCNSIVVGGQRTGLLFTFKSIRHINTEFSQIASGDAKAKFSCYEQWLFPSSLVNEAKSLAVTDRIILIEAMPGHGDRLLAHCIHYFSNRAQLPLVTIDCDHPIDLIEQTVFGELGRLHMAHGGTVLLRRIELLPLYLQRKMVEFLRTRRLSHNGGKGVSVDVRLIFSSNSNLKHFVDEGTMLDELYYRIAENILILLPLSHDRPQLCRMIDHTIAFFQQQYQKPNLALSDGAARLLYGYDWPGNLTELDLVLDLLVEKATDGIVSEAFLLSIYGPLGGDKQIRSIEQMEKEHIRQLLLSGQTKDSVARTLGIGRATLYRKIKQYNL